MYDALRKKKKKSRNMQKKNNHLLGWTDSKL